MDPLELPAAEVPGEEEGMVIGEAEESMERRMACWIWTSSGLLEAPMTATSSSSSSEEM